MNQYRFLCNIIFNGKRFKIFSNNNSSKTFLQVLDNNSLSYPKLEDYIKLDKIYNVHKSDILYLRKFNFKPGAFYKGKYIAAGVLSVIIGLLSTSSTTNYKNNYEQFTNILEQQDITELPNEEEFLDMVEKENQEEVPTQYAQVTMDNYNGTNWCLSKENEILVKNNDEFRKYVDNPNPTFDDVRKAVENNNNIDENVRPLLTEYIEELEKSYPNLDLVCFYENIKRLYITYETQEELEEYDRAAYYNRLEGFLCFNEDQDIDKHIAFHEFTHMLTEAHIVKDDKKIVRSALSWKYNETENKILEFGRAYGEAIDEIFLMSIFGPETGKNYATVYREYVDIINYATYLGISITDMQQSNVRYIIEELEKKGIEDIQHIIELMDTEEFSRNNTSDIELETDIRLECYLLFFENLTKYKLEQNENPKQIYLDIMNLLENGYIQETYGYSMFYPEQKHLIQKTLNHVQSILGIKETSLKMQNEQMEDFLYIEQNDKGYNVYILSAKKDENGNIKTYERFTDIECNIDSRYGEFYTTLIEKNLIKWDDKGNFSFTLNEEELWFYCREKISKDKLYLLFGDARRHYYYAVENINGETEYWNTTTLEKETPPTQLVGEYVSVLKEKGILDDELEIDVKKFYEYFGKDPTKMIENERYEKARDRMENIERTTEKLIYLNTEAPDSPIEIYLAKKDENGKLLIYDRYTYKQVNINTDYCEFASTLKENGFFTLNKITNKINVLDKRQFLDYCNDKNNKINIDIRNADKEKVVKNENGSYIITTTNTKLDTNRYKYYNDSIKIYDNILYYYDINNNLIKIEALLETNHNEEKTIDKTTFKPNGSYTQIIKRFDSNQNIYETIETIYNSEQQIKTSNRELKNEYEELDEIVTIFDYKVTSPFIFDGYMADGDYVYRTVNKETVIKQDNGIIYIYKEPELRSPYSKYNLKEAYSISEEKGITTYTNDGKKDKYDNKKGIIIKYKSDESIDKIEDPYKSVSYYDYDKKSIEEIINKTTSKLSFSTYNKDYIIGAEERIYFNENGKIKYLDINIFDDISRGTNNDDQIKYITDICVNILNIQPYKEELIKLYINDTGNVFQVHTKDVIIAFFKDNPNYFLANIKGECWRIYENSNILYESTDFNDFNIIYDEQSEYGKREIQSIELTDGTIIDPSHQTEIKKFK